MRCQVATLASLDRPKWPINLGSLCQWGEGALGGRVHVGITLVNANITVGAGELYSAHMYEMEIYIGSSGVEGPHIYT